MTHLPVLDGEHLIRIVHEHWIRYVFPVFASCVVTAIGLLLVYLAAVTAYHTPWIAYASFLGGCALLLGALHWFFFLLMSEAVTSVIVTNRRVIYLHARLFFEDELAEVSFERIKTVKARRDGLLQNVLQYGSLWFDTGVRIPNIPHPGAVARDIEQAMGLT